MKLLYVLINYLLILGFNNFNVIAQKSESTPLYITTLLTDYAPKSKTRFEKQDIGKVKIIYHHEIDPNNIGQVNYELLINSISKKIPNKNEEGICILDWEGPQFEYLKFAKIDYDSMNRIVKKFNDMLTFARQLRPYAKWGIYDMPVTTYWVKQDTSWQIRSKIIVPLIKNCDILCPSLYDFFSTGSYEWMDDEAYYKINTERALILSKKYNKKVYPFMWHRYHDATEKIGLTCINPDEFVTQLKLINKIKVDNKGIDGLIWWQEDQYYLGIKHPVILNELKGRTNESYLDEIALKYLDLFQIGLKKE